MNIAGSGSIPGGVYQDSIHISGSGRVTGDVSCIDFKVSGSGRVSGKLQASGSVGVSGSGNVDGDLETGSLHTAGAFNCDGCITVKGDAVISGAMSCQSLTATEIQMSGGCSVDGDMTAEIARIHGSIKSEGLLNAEDIEIKFAPSSEFGSIGGSKITIEPSRDEVKRGLFRRLFSSKNHPGNFLVKDSIEGDEISLKYVTAPTVSGRVVTVGPGCIIEKLEYTESCDISPDAVVQNAEGPEIF